MSLRLRMNLMILITGISMLGIGFIYAIHNARSNVTREMDAALRATVQILDAGMEQAETDTQRVLWLQQMLKLEPLRQIQLFVQNSPELTPPRNHGLNESQQAPRWFTRLIKPESRILLKRYPLANGSMLDISMVSNPEAELLETWDETRSFLGVMLGLVIGISLLVQIILGRAFNAVGSIVLSLEAMEKGDFRVRLPKLSVSEFDRISRTLNHTADALQSAQAENRLMVQHGLQIQEDERRHLAQEMHDELAQSLTAIKVMVASMPHQHDRAARNKTATGVMDICDHLFTVVRGMMQRLSPMMLEELGLEAALQHLVNTWQQQHPATQLYYQYTLLNQPASPALRIHVYRMLQETLTNIARHANARQVVIKIYQPVIANLHLHIRDDGQGFDPQGLPQGFGLRGLQERVRSLNGSCQIQSQPGVGTTLDIELPLAPPP